MAACTRSGWGTPPLNRTSKTIGIRLLLRSSRAQDPLDLWLIQYRRRKIKGARHPSPDHLVMNSAWRLDLGRRTDQGQRLWHVLPGSFGILHLHLGTVETFLSGCYILWVDFVRAPRSRVGCCLASRAMYARQVIYKVPISRGTI